jgi:hypothetical protein
MAFHLQVKNFRNLKDVQIENSEPITLIAGENESGKSSIAAAIEYVFTNGAMGAKGADSRLLVTDGSSEGMHVEMDMDGLHLKRTLSSGTSQKAIAGMLGTEAKVLPLMFPQSLDVSKGSASIKAYLNTLRDVKYDFNLLLTVMPEFKAFYDMALSEGIDASFKALVDHGEAKRAASKYVGVAQEPALSRPTAEQAQDAEDRRVNLNENLTKLREDLGTCQREIAALESDLAKAPAAVSVAPVKPDGAQPTSAEIEKLRGKVDDLRTEEQRLSNELGFQQGRRVTLDAACTEAAKTVKIITDAPVKPEGVRPTAKALADAQTLIQTTLTSKIQEESKLTPLRDVEKLLKDVQVHLDVMEKHEAAVAAHAEKSKDPLKERRADLQAVAGLTADQITTMASVLRASKLPGAEKDAAALDAVAAKVADYQAAALAVLTDNPLPGKAPVAPAGAPEVLRHLERNPADGVAAALAQTQASIMAQSGLVDDAVTAWDKAKTTEFDLKKSGKAWADYDVKHEAFAASNRLTANRVELTGIETRIATQQTDVTKATAGIVTAQANLTAKSDLLAEWSAYETASQAYSQAQASDALRASTQTQLTAKKVTEAALRDDIGKKQTALENAMTDREAVVRSQDQWATYDQSRGEIKTKTEEADVEWGKWDGWVKKLQSEERQYNNTQAAGFTTMLNEFAKNTLGDRKIEIGDTEFTVGNRPARLLSGSAQWRLTACVSAAVAKSINCPILVLDGADVLDSKHRRDLMAFISRDLAPSFKHVLLTSTCQDASKETDFQPGYPIKKYLLKNGSLAPLPPYVGPAKATAAQPTKVPSVGMVSPLAVTAGAPEMQMAKR